MRANARCRLRLMRPRDESIAAFASDCLFAMRQCAHLSARVAHLPLELSAFATRYAACIVNSFEQTAHTA